MIASISGTVLEREEKSFIVDVQGIGYRVFVGRAVAEKAQEGDSVRLYTYHHITESGQRLFGFLEKGEMEYFELLLDVPSVGPSTARNILDIAPPKTLAQAVASEDVTLLTKVSGIGKRTAERIIVELKEKIGAVDVSGATGGLQQETIEALVSMGYTVSQARAAVSKLSRDVETVEEGVKAVLKQVA